MSYPIPTTDASTNGAAGDPGAPAREGPKPRAPVADWATDFDHVDPGYAARAPEIWDELRQECPVAHSDRYGGTWLPVRHTDVCAIAKDTDTFTSNGVVVHDGRPDIPPPVGFAPPITSDPPFHRIAREFLLPAFAPKPIAAKRESTRETCRELLDDLLADVEAGRTDIVDAALGYTQHIPVRVIADMLGVPRSDGDQFRVFIHRIMEQPGTELHVEYEDSIDFYLDELIAQRATEPRDDLISHMTHAKIAGQPLEHEHIRGTCALLIIAGVDTTWSSIGASLWHMAQHPEDRRRWVEDPAVQPFAVEEFHGPAGGHRRRVRGPVDAGQRLGAAAVPGRQPRPRGLRGRRHLRDRPHAQPPCRLRVGHPPLPGIEPGPHGADCGPGGVDGPCPRLRVGRP